MLEFIIFMYFFVPDQGYRNSLEGPPPVPILQQLHQTPHMPAHNDSSGYYRTTGTSPLMTLGTPGHSANTTLSNGSRPYDDLESDDDLDREDITFPSDAGLSRLRSYRYSDNDHYVSLVKKSWERAISRCNLTDVCNIVREQ